MIISAGLESLLSVKMIRSFVILKDVMQQILSTTCLRIQDTSGFLTPSRYQKMIRRVNKYPRSPFEIYNLFQRHPLSTSMHF